MWKLFLTYQFRMETVEYVIKKIFEFGKKYTLNKKSFFHEKKIIFVLIWKLRSTIIFNIRTNIIRMEKLSDCGNFSAKFTLEVEGESLKKILNFHLTYNSGGVSERILCLDPPTCLNQTLYVTPLVTSMRKYVMRPDII